MIPALRDMVAVGHGKDVFFRSWDNWASTVEAYTAITDAVPPHEHLYMSVKHSAADFVRPAKWNPTLGVGNHAQIVEVELQVRARARECTQSIRAAAAAAAAHSSFAKYICTMHHGGTRWLWWYQLYELCAL